MEKLVKRIVNITALALAVTATIAGLYVALKGASVGSPSASLDVSFYITYILLFAIIAMLVFFVVMQVFSTKKTMISTLVLIAIAVVVALFSYVISSSELSEVAVRVGASESTYRMSGTLLNFAYICFIGVILAFLGSFIYTKIKK